MDLKSVVPTSMTGHHQRRRLLVRLSLAAIVVAALVVSLATLAWALTPSFPDVPVGHQYYTAISDLASRGIIGGYTNGDFGPNDLVKRQQFAKMAVLTGGYPVSEGDVCPFTDVAQGGSTDPLFPDNYIAVCAAHGITTGKTATTFDPYSNITRLQATTMVVRMADNLQPGLLAAPPAGWAGNAAWAANSTHGANAARAEYNGLLAGLNLSTLSPTGNMTRGEVAQVLHNLLGRLAGVPGSDGGDGGSATGPFTLGTYTYGGGGHITADPNLAQYPAGSSVVLTAIANPGYTFTGWGGDASGTANPYTVVVNSNMTVTASFSAGAGASHILGVSVPGGHGSIAVSPNQSSFAHGASAVLTANPAAGYTFTGWGGDLAGTTNPATVVMDADKTITATFTAVPAGQFTLTVTVPGGHGTVSRNPEQATYPSGTSVTLAATPAGGYVFAGWSGALAGTTNPATVVMDADKTITATFTAAAAPQFTLTTAVPDGNGSITIDPAQATYASGTVVTLTAVPDPGCVFTGWGKDASGSAMTYQLTIVEDALVHASFDRTFEIVGGVITSAPAVCSTGANTLDVFARGTDGALKHIMYTGGSWSGWQDLGGVVKAGSDPAAVASRGGRMDVFVRGTDDALWHKWFKDGVWSAWESVGGVLSSSPAACQRAGVSDTHIEVLIRGSEGSMWWNVLWPAGLGGWAVWSDYPVTLPSAFSPAVTSVTSTSFHLFYCGDDGALWHRSMLADGYWSIAESLGGVLTSSPAACSWGSDRVDVFARGSDQALWHIARTGSTWSAWEDQKTAQFKSAPGAASWGPNRIDVFVRGSDDALWHRYWDGSAWLP